jgi:hypothetical protein
MGFLLKLRTAVWGAPAATKTERHLIVKIDCFIMSYVCLMVRDPKMGSSGEGRPLICAPVLGQLS